MFSDPHSRLGRDHLPPGVAPLGRKDPRVVGPYRIVGRIARDVAGPTLLGLDGQGAPVRIRLFPADLADAPDVRAGLTAEVGRLVRGRAVCAAAYLGSEVRAPEPWLATEYVPGRTLAEHVTEHGRLTEGLLTCLAVGLAEALAARHALGCTHLALDPSKVVLSPRGPKVVDFGVSRVTGKAIGDRRWAAPEQRVDGARVTGYADVFAWGNLVRFAATGWEPSGEVTAEPDPGAVPEPLAPLVRRALVEEPEQRPTALELLEELTEGKGADLASVVFDLLATEWGGVSAPEPRRTRRSYTPLLVSGVAVVLVAALVGGWLVFRPAQGTSELANGGEVAAGTDAEGAEEEPSGPIIAEDPQEIDAVVAEVVELALEASSFTTSEFRYTNGVGDSVWTLYLQAQEPIPAFSKGIHLGPTGSGVLAMGPELEDLVYFIDNPTTIDGEREREYYQDSGASGDGQSSGHPRQEWEDLVEGLPKVLNSADLAYEGLSQVPVEFLNEEILEGEDPSTRSGHHYTGTYVEKGYTDLGEMEATIDIWISEEGYPLHVHRIATSAQGLNEYGEPLELGHLLDFARFNESVDLYIPAEDEILPEPSGF